MEKNMNTTLLNKLSRHLVIASLGAASGLTILTADTNAAIDMRKRPSLVITNKATPDMPRASIPAYSSPVRVPNISASQVSQDAYFQPTTTVVTEKVNSLRSDLSGLQSRVGNLTSKLKGMQDRNQSMSAEYNASLATINTQLQSGTTPGNPRLVEKLSIAQSNLDNLSQSVADLNSMSVEAANAASMGSFLLDACRAAYGLSGAVEEDHAALAQIEDQTNNTIVQIDRLLNELNDDITRSAAYLSAERGNMRTLAFAVTNGDYYGRSLANRPFSGAPQSNMMVSPSAGGDFIGGTSSNAYPAPAVQSAALSSPRPLVKIKFDQPNVEYEQAVYMAMNEAMQKYPNARYELIAVTPTNGNAAQVAIESTHARRNAESVLRSLSQMGLDVNRIDLTTQQNAEAKTNEVHIFMR
jgi:hypothetical protein